MYIEIFKQGKLIKRITETLSNISWSNELMLVPSVSLTLPAEYITCFDGREDVKIHINGKVFYGHVKDNITVDNADETMTVNLSHIVCEWEYRQISVNHAVDDELVNVVFKGDKVRKDRGNGEGITASDFALSSRYVKNLTSARAIKRAGATAWQINSGDPVEITNVDLSNIKKKDGEYNVTFSTAKGTSVTVKCTVNASVQIGGEVTNKNGKPPTGTGEKIKAHNFTVNMDSWDLSDAQILKYSKAYAYKYRKPKDKIEPLHIVSNGIRQSEGKYNVVIGTPNNKTTLTIKVTVNDHELPETVRDPSIIDNLEDIYSDLNFAYPGWEIDWQDESGDRAIDYVYSRQNKLEALTKTIELTDDLFWRVGFTGEKIIEVGKFGKKQPYILSMKPNGETNRQIIEEPEIEKDFGNVINVATVYSDKSDSGMSSLTLREVYNNQDYQKEGFPVVILRDNANNERDYSKYGYPATQPPQIAPNNEWEFAVLDEESIALESGILIEGTYAFNDLGSFNTESKKITNEKRRRASRRAYRAAVRKLKQARRNYKIKVTVAEMPADVNVGDKVRLIYDNLIYKIGECSNYYKKLLSHDDWFYIERMTWDIDGNGVEVNELTLSKFIRVERETRND